MIDLGEYPNWVTKYIKSQGLACVYVISYPDGRPSKIGYAQDISARFGSIQASNAHTLTLEFVVWLDDVRTAQFVEQAAQLNLKNMQVRGEWFDVHPEMAMEVVREAARAADYHDGIMLEHHELLEKLKKHGIKAKFDRRRKPARYRYYDTVPPPRFVRG